ncbi:Yip1 family protein [Aldersonia kunmingensis]|uniref:Yip1 family protein n=1 Tax=Aldersonia kunmingensis TaxID=408066 RepID=UPI00082F0D8E|nr:Yip1 family protein [Aldersonia kunmingensis]
MSPAENPNETGQISVAELLARNGRAGGAGGSSGGGRRRRGESDGGISVTDLTGEIPVVRDATRHRRAAEPEDDAQEIAAAAAPPPTPVAPPSPPPTPVAPPRAPVPDPAPDSSGDSTGDTVHAWSEYEREPQLLSGGSTVASEMLRNSIEATRDDPPVETRAPAAPSFAAPAPVAPTPPAPPATQPSPEAPPKPERRLFRKEFPVVDVPSWALTGNIDVPQSPTFGGWTAPHPAKRDEPEGWADEESDYLDSDYLEADGIEPEIDEVDYDDEVDFDEGEQADEHEEDVGEGSSPLKQWLALAVEAGVALVVGGLLFKGFERLWDMLPWVALVLSVMVILGLVALVRVVRRTDDILSFVIAIVVGIFVTIGPLAFLLSTG